jgi:hypothetical protein
MQLKAKSEIFTHFNLYTFTGKKAEWIGIVVMLQTYEGSVRTMAILTRAFHGFPQSLKANSWIVLN